MRAQEAAASQPSGLIVDTRERGSADSSAVHTVYVIRMDDGPTTREIERRYSAFRAVYLALRKLTPLPAAAAAPFPPLRWFNRTSASVVQQRRLALQGFIDTLLADAAAARLAEVSAFFEFRKTAPHPSPLPPQPAQREALPSRTAEALRSEDSDALELLGDLRAQVEELAVQTREVLHVRPDAPSQQQLLAELAGVRSLVDDLRGQRRVLKKEVLTLREAAAVAEAERQTLRRELAEAQMMASTREQALAAREETDNRLISTCLSIRMQLARADTAFTAAYDSEHSSSSFGGTDPAEERTAATSTTLLLRQVRQHAAKLADGRVMQGLEGAIAAQLSELFVENARLREQLSVTRGRASSLSSTVTSPLPTLSVPDDAPFSPDSTRRNSNGSLSGRGSRGEKRSGAGRWRSVYGFDANGHAPGLSYNTLTAPNTFSSE